ncbi:retrovirus-related pol polyprotein from transposon TNT 1-94 [Tanacetum coccineum]
MEKGTCNQTHTSVVISNTHVAMPVTDDEETLILDDESRSKMFEKAKDPKVIAKKISHKPIDYEKLNRLSEDFKTRFTPQQELSAEQAFWFHILNPTIEPSYSPPVIVDVPSELPKVSLVNASLKKLKFHLAQFDYVVKKRTTPSALEEGEWGFEHTKTVFNNEIIPFLKSLKDIFNVFDKDLLNEITEVQIFFDQMEAAVQQCSVDKQCVEIAKKENDRLLHKIMSQDVMITVMNSMSVTNESANMEMKICESWKEIVENVVHIPSANTIAPGMFKLDLEPLPPRLLQIRKVYIDYLRTTQEQANVLREIVKQAKAKQHLDGELDLACKYTTRIQKLLVYVQDTCPNAIIPNTRKVVVTPMNNVKKVRFAKPLTFSSNNKQVESSNTSYSNTPVMSSTGVKCLLGIADQSLQAIKRMIGSRKHQMNKKNKVEAQPRKVNNSNRVVKPVCDVDVKHLLLSRLNDQIARIMGYGDYQLENVIISRVYYVEGLGHNLFSVGQFCDADLGVAFRKNTCFIRNLEGVDLLSGSRDTNFYTISLDDMLKSSPIYLLSKALKTKSWLWRRRLSHLNFGNLNKLAKDGLARGILRLKFQKDHLCSACALGKSKKSSH